MFAFLYERAREGVLIYDLQHSTMIARQQFDVLFGLRVRKVTIHSSLGPEKLKCLQLRQLGTCYQALPRNSRAETHAECLASGSGKALIRDQFESQVPQVIKFGLSREYLSFRKP